DDAFRAPAGERLAGSAAPRRAGLKPRTGVLAALLALVALLALAGGYLWWSGGDGGPAVTEAPSPAAPEAEPAASTAGELAATPPEDEAAEEETAAAEPQTETAPASGGQEKFTQRLMPDGTEVDEGPAGGQP